MKIQALGVGSAFTTQDYWQSNFIIESARGKRLMYDCGGDARFSMKDAGLELKDIDSIYISHLHNDHIGGMEWVAFSTFFSELPRMNLFMDENLMDAMWETSLKGGLESIETQVMNLTNYFNCHPIAPQGSFEWEGMIFELVQTVHVMNGRIIMPSFGLMISQFIKDQPTRKVFMPGDLQFCPNQIQKFYNQAQVIFQDCETSPFKSGVHAHYDDLKTLPIETKEKMWLYHYQPNPPQNPVEDGFLGFIQKGQTFDFSTLELLMDDKGVERVSV